MNDTIQTYVWPNDGYDYCHSCNYLEQVHTTFSLDGEAIVPLCFDCAVEIGEA